MQGDDGDCAISASASLEGLCTDQRKHCEVHIIQELDSMTYHPLDMFKKATSFLYREIGILKPFNHPEVNDKRSNEYGVIVKSCGWSHVEDDVDCTGSVIIRFCQYIHPLLAQ